MKLWSLSPNLKVPTDGEAFEGSSPMFAVPIPQDDPSLTRVQALERLADLIAQALPRELARIDKITRQFSPYLPLNTQRSIISTEELSQILKAPKPNVWLLGLASFHQSGYVRERAVWRLSELRLGQELPFLLLRLNDWVPPVYEASLRAIQERLIPEYAEGFVRNLQLVLELEGQTRREHGPVLTAISSLLKRPESDAAVQQGTISAEKQVRRLCFQILEEADDTRLISAISRALADPDSVIRRQAARSARVKLPDDALLTLLPLMRQDVSAVIRRQALYTEIERFPETASRELTKALLDSHASLRETARYHLQKTSEVDIPDFYRQMLASVVSSAQLITAISGLGETGTVADTSLLLPYLSHPLTKVRRSTVKAFSKLDGDNQIPVFLSALLDTSPRVSHEARESLRPRLHLVDDTILWHLFISDVPLFVRQDALTLLASLGKWNSIPFLVRAAADSEEAIRERAMEHIRGWLGGYNGSFTRPTSAQITRLKEALQINSIASLEALVRDWEAKGTA